MKPSKARRRLPFEFADRQGAFHRAGTVGRRRRLGRAQQGWARAQSVDDLAGATGWTARSGLGSIDGGRAGPGGGPRRSAANHALRSCSRDGQCHVGASARHGEALATSKKRPLPVQGQAPGAMACKAPPRRRGRGGRKARTIERREAHMQPSLLRARWPRPWRAISTPLGLGLVSRHGRAVNSRRGRPPRGQKARGLRLGPPLEGGSARSACIFAAMHHRRVGGNPCCEAPRGPAKALARPAHQAFVLRRTATP
jgi:hypothetical protein